LCAQAGIDLLDEDVIIQIEAPADMSMQDDAVIMRSVRNTLATTSGAPTSRFVGENITENEATGGVTVRVRITTDAASEQTTTQVLQDVLDNRAELTQQITVAPRVERVVVQAPVAAGGLGSAGEATIIENNTELPVGHWIFLAVIAILLIANLYQQWRAANKDKGPKGLYAGRTGYSGFQEQAPPPRLQPSMYATGMDPYEQSGLRYMYESQRDLTRQPSAQSLAPNERIRRPTSQLELAPISRGPSRPADASGIEENVNETDFKSEI
jgi:hypothetical protein